MVLETERLYLRELMQTDFQSLCKILQDEQTMYAYEGAFNDAEVQEWLDRQISRYQEFGFGPWAVILKEKARGLAEEKGFNDKLALYELVERLSPGAFLRTTGKEKVICANVDFYSGLIYQMLGIPEELFTPMFAVSRIAGWCAHRIEELTTGGRIMRPAYRALPVRQKYVPLDQR